MSKDGGTFTDGTNEAVEVATSSGMYTLSLTATEMNADIVAVITKTTTTNAKTAVNVMYTVTRQLVDLLFPVTSGTGLDVTAGGNAGVDFDNIVGTLDAAEIGAAALTAAKFAAGAIDSNALAASAVTEIRSLATGTADSGSTTTVVDTERTEADADYWKGCVILFTSGTIINQARLITAFNATTDTLTFSPATTQAAGTNTYEILSAAAADLRLWNGTSPNNLIAGRVDANMQALAADVITAAAIANGAIDAATFAAGAIDAAAIGTGAIDADAIAAAAITAAKFGAGAIDAAAIGTGAIDADAIAAAALTAAKFGAGAIDANALAADAVTEIRSLASGTSDSGSTTTMVDAARTEADADYWKGCSILFTSGTIANQVRLITGFNAATDTITFSPATTQAVATQTYEILPAARADVALWIGTAVNALQSGRVDAFVGALAAAVITSGAFAAGAIDNAAFNVTETLTANPAAGGIVSTSFGAGAIDAAAIAPDAIGASELAADAVNEIADGLMTRASSNWEASAGVKSLGAAVMKAVHRVRDNAGTLEIYRSNGTTIHASQTITTDAANAPIDELTGAV